MCCCVCAVCCALLCCACSVVPPCRPAYLTSPRLGLAHAANWTAPGGYAGSAGVGQGWRRDRRLDGGPANDGEEVAPRRPDTRALYSCSHPVLSTEDGGPSSCYSVQKPREYFGGTEDGAWWRMEYFGRGEGRGRATGSYYCVCGLLCTVLVQLFLSSVPVDSVWLLTESLGEMEGVPRAW